MREGVNEWAASCYVMLCCVLQNIEKLLAWRLESRLETFCWSKTLEECLCLCVCVLRPPGSVLKIQPDRINRKPKTDEKKKKERWGKREKESDLSQVSKVQNNCQYQKEKNRLKGTETESDKKKEGVLRNFVLRKLCQNLAGLARLLRRQRFSHGTD